MNRAAVLKKLRDFYPEYRQYQWDNSGTQINLDGEIDTIALALDATVEAVIQAKEAGAQLLLTHHPLFFKAPKAIDAQKLSGAVAIECIRNNISLYAMHTSYDNHPRGMGFHGLRALGVEGLKPLKEVGATKLSKLVVFTPAEARESLVAALAAAGAGSIGNYSHCRFSVEGEGSFLPLTDAKPHIGEVGSVEQLREERLEMIFPSNCKGAIIQAVLREHPYESPAYDIYSLENRIDPWGCGALGRHPEGLSGPQLLAELEEFFGAPPEKIYGSIDKRSKKIGYVGGVGSDFIRDAVRARCDVYITGEVRYHDLEYARGSSTAIIQMGHGVSERPAFYACAEDVATATGCRVVTCEDEFETF